MKTINRLLCFHVRAPLDPVCIHCGAPLTAPSVIINWETANHQRAASAQTADVNGVRLYVKRTIKRGHFYGHIDGKIVAGPCMNIEQAKRETIRAYVNKVNNITE